MSSDGGSVPLNASLFSIRPKTVLNGSSVSGTFTIDFQKESIGTLSHDATEADVTSLLLDVAGIQNVDVTRSHDPVAGSYSWTITFLELAHDMPLNVDLLMPNDANIVGGNTAIVVAEEKIAGASSTSIVAWSGKQWNPLGGGIHGLNSSVSAIEATHDGTHLVAIGGDFDHVVQIVAENVTFGNALLNFTTNYTRSVLLRSESIAIWNVRQKCWMQIPGNVFGTVEAIAFTKIQALLTGSAISGLGGEDNVAIVAGGHFSVLSEDDVPEVQHVVTVLERVDEVQTIRTRGTIQPEEQLVTINVTSLHDTYRIKSDALVRIDEVQQVSTSITSINPILTIDLAAR